METAGLSPSHDPTQTPLPPPARAASGERGEGKWEAQRFSQRADLKGSPATRLPSSGGLTGREVGLPESREVAAASSSSLQPWLGEARSAN